MASKYTPNWGKAGDNASYLQTVAMITFPGMAYQRFILGAPVAVQTGSTCAVKALILTEMGVIVQPHSYNGIPDEILIPWAGVSFVAPVKAQE